MVILNDATTAQDSTGLPTNNIGIINGDSIYAVSLGDVPADLDAVGVIGARVMAKAIVRAVEAADSAYGFPAARDL